MNLQVPFRRYVEGIYLRTTVCLFFDRFDLFSVHLLQSVCPGLRTGGLDATGRTVTVLLFNRIEVPPG